MGINFIPLSAQLVFMESTLIQTENRKKKVLRY